MSIFIDGPNFINAIKSHGIDNDTISKYLSLINLRNVLMNRGATISPHGRVHFICSNKLFGGREDKFSIDQRDIMLRRFKFEPGVHVDQVDIEGKEEKGVDITLAIKMIRYSESETSMAIISEDRDYIPVLKYLAEKSSKVIAVKVRTQSYPEEIANEAYSYTDISENVHELFVFNPFNMSIREIEHKAKDFITHGINEIECKICVDESGIIYTIGRHGQFPERVRYFMIRNLSSKAEMGPKAASNKLYVEWFIKTMRAAWDSQYSGNVLDKYPPFA